jgi:hypothetical protein
MEESDEKEREKKKILPLLRDQALVLSIVSIKPWKFW